MAKSTSTATGVADKSYSPSFQHEAPSLVDGRVQHELVPVSAQVRILSLIDATGSATIGDIIADLPDHPDPVGAVIVMERLNIVVLEIKGVLDANSIVRRAHDPDPEIDPDPSGSGCGEKVPSGEADNGNELPSGIKALVVNPFSPVVVVGSGSERRAFVRADTLRRPGIYVLMNGTSAYVGMGTDLGARIAGGQQPIDGVETIIAITDANDTLTPEDARAIERILWSRVHASGERALVNGVPDGHGVDPERYDHLQVFVGEACLALRHQGVLFTGGSIRALMAGPRGEPGRIGALRPFNDIPEGEIVEMAFGDGLVALAAKQAENRWLLLRGSDVRIGTAASANASVRYLRSAWLHSGLLAVSPDGKSYTVMRDLIFPSGSAAAQFCCGSKGRGLSAWMPIDPDGGYDPDTPALIAS